MVMSHPYVSELPSIWFDKWRCEDAEKAFRLKQSGGNTLKGGEGSALVTEIANARRHIQNSLKTNSVSEGGVDNAVVSRLENLELENKELRSVTNDLRDIIRALETRMLAMEKAAGHTGQTTTAARPAAAAKPAAAPAADDDDDDFELFGSDDEEEDAEAARVREQRLADYAAKKATKKVIIAKSSILLDVKPWDDETDMAELEKCVRTVQMDGLLWGASKLVPLAFGIKKLQISCVVEDDKVGTDDLEEAITVFEDYVQSVDIAAFNKI